MHMDTTAALLRAPDSSSPRPRSLGTPHADYDEPVCDPETVHGFQGILTAVALGALLWMPILWLIL